MARPCGVCFFSTPLMLKPLKPVQTMWYYLDKNNNRKGPVGIDVLTKKITLDTPVWKEGMPDWTPAKEVPEVKRLMAPPIPGTPPPVHGKVGFWQGFFKTIRVVMWIVFFLVVGMYGLRILGAYLQYQEQQNKKWYENR
jgi:hypothetical protein